jgi:glucodextranase-like protein
MEAMSSKKILQIAGLFFFFLLIILYAFWGSHNLIFGVKIKNVNIADGTKVSNAVIAVTGNAKNAVNLTLNGREITVNQAGDFNETIALLLGYNIVEIRAKDKFGYMDEKDYKLIY